LKILNVLPYWGPEFGGQFLNTVNIAANIILKGHQASIITCTPTPKEINKKYIWTIGENNFSIPVHICKSNTKLAYFSEAFRIEFPSIVYGYDTVLIHGLWTFPTSFAASFCRKHKIPYIIFTHAMMSEWSLSQRRLNKEIYFRIIEKNNLNNADAICVMDKTESLSVEKHGITTKKFCFENALNKEEIILAKKTRKLSKKPSDKTNILYLSRIHSKKGLDILIKAIVELSKKKLDINLTVAGKSQNSEYLRRIRFLIKKNSIERYVNFCDGVYGEKKKSLFINADIFVLPSADDSKPLAILEAMSYGLPIVTTPGCKMPEIDGKMGYVVERNSLEIAQAINELIKNKDKANKMGERGYEYILDYFTWEKRINELMKILNYYKK